MSPAVFQSGCLQRRRRRSYPDRPRERATFHASTRVRTLPSGHWSIDVQPFEAARLKATLPAGNPTGWTEPGWEGAPAPEAEVGLIRAPGTGLAARDPLVDRVGRPRRRVVAGDGSQGTQAVFEARHRPGSPMAFTAFDLLAPDGQLSFPPRAPRRLAVLRAGRIHELVPVVGEAGSTTIVQVDWRATCRLR